MANKLLLNDVYSHCFDPQRVEITDPITRERVVREVPCGKCYHCRITKVNEWVTRMSLQFNKSMYCYFITLTYDSFTDRSVIDGTYPCYSYFNQFHKYQLYPLCLNKSHLQKFFKRLRKNTGIKFQYYAAGEYGSTYARPHYHVIIWSDDPISSEMVQYAWSVPVDDSSRLKIGNIDFVDLKSLDNEPDKHFKYVCKYVNKSYNELEKLCSHGLHFKNYRKNFSHLNDGTFSWLDYQKTFSPFVLCSKKPAIGYFYFAENKKRFQKRDFRIFELQGNCIFPSYYTRKTRESICPFKTISLENGKPNSYSNIPSVVSLLVDIQNAISYNKSVREASEIMPRFSRDKTTISFFSDTLGGSTIIESKYFSFYNCSNHFHYDLIEHSNSLVYLVTSGDGNFIKLMSLDDMICDLDRTYSKLINNFIKPMYYSSKLKQTEKDQLLVSEFGNVYKYKLARKLCLRNLKNSIDTRQHIYNLSKTQF